MISKIILLSSDSYNLMLRTLVNEYGAYLNRMNVPFKFGRTLLKLKKRERKSKSVRSRICSASVDCCVLFVKVTLVLKASTTV